MSESAPQDDHTDGMPDQIRFDTDRQVENIVLTTLSTGDAVADIDLVGGETERIVFTRSQAVAFRKQIAVTYDRADSLDPIDGGSHE